MIRCPYCQHEMQLVGAKPGRFQPACPQCRQKFALTIPFELNEQPTVKPIAETLPPSITIALGIEESPAKPPPVAAVATVAPTIPSANPTNPATYDAETSPAPIGLGAPAADIPPIVAPTLAPTPNQLNAIEPQVSRRLDGYELVRKLGQGGMGAVYLARQLSLDRNVALKVLLPHFADDKQFVSRFIREAYAAAQLTHHNIVQIHDIGAERSTHFFSMELVEGHTLAGLLRERGPMDAETAVNYVLQAARGLKFAHEHGMIHRDVKPENLMLNLHGIVKVADLGLVKIPTRAKAGAASPSTTDAGEKRWYDNDSDTTQLNISMGTPSYMPPEQAADAHSVDVRADIYALGCTLYALVTGRPPFTGASALEVITKHLREPVVPPDRVVDHLPEYLSHAIMKMLAKKPQDRYQDMTTVIAALEEFLGVKTTGPFEPTDEQIATVLKCANDFHNSGWAKIRLRLAQTFMPLCGIALLVMAFLPLGATTKYQSIAGMIGFALLTPLVYLIVQGLHDKTYLFDKIRDYVMGGGVVHLFIWLGLLSAFGGLLVLLNVGIAWLIALGAATVVAVVFHFLFDSTVTSEQSKSVTHAEAMLKQIRMRTAAAEAALEQFVCKYGGEHWEGLFEAMFGYEAKLEARKRWGAVTESIGRAGKGDRRRPRPKFAAWRDPIIEWIEMRLRARREAQDRRFLELVERESLRARGFPDAAARKKAREVAVSIVVKAADLRDAARDDVMAETEPPPPTPQGDGEAKSDEELAREAEEAKQRRRRPVLDDEGLEGYERQSFFQRRYGGWSGLFLGPAVRLVLGAVLLVGCILWAKQNGFLPTRADAGLVDRGSDLPAAGKTSPVLTAAGTAAPTGGATPRLARRPALSVTFLSRAITDWVDGWHVGVAAVMLILSAFVRHPKVGLFVLPAACVMIIGPALFVESRELVRVGVPVSVGLLVSLIGVNVLRD